MSSNSFNPGDAAEALIKYAERERNGSLFKEWINKSPCNYITLEECQTDTIYQHYYNNVDIRYSYVSQVFSDLIDRLSRDSNNDLIKRIVEFLYAFKDGRESYDEEPTRKDCKTFEALYSIFDSIEQTNKTKFDGLDESIKTLTQQKTDLSNQVNYLTRQKNQYVKENLTQEKDKLQAEKENLIKNKTELTSKVNDLIQEKFNLESQVNEFSKKSKILCGELNVISHRLSLGDYRCVEEKASFYLAESYVNTDQLVA